MPGKELSILYCDDQEGFRRRFLARHGERFDVEVSTDISDVLGALDRRADLPDLLVLDLYHDIDRSDPAQARRVAEAETALRELDCVLGEVKGKVDRAWKPAALETLEQVRERFPADQLPILVYSQRGLFFLDEGQLTEVEDSQAHWMLKHKGEHDEVERMRRVAAGRPARRLPRDITIALVSVIAGAALTPALQQLLG